VSRASPQRRTDPNPGRRARSVGGHDRRRGRPCPVDCWPNMTIIVI
jgi:hypothetical protein